TPSARCLLIGYSHTDQILERQRLRSHLRRRIHQLQAVATTRPEIDVSILAVDAPHTADHALLTQRTVEHVSHLGAALAHGIVVPLEDLRTQTLSAAAAWKS